MNTRQEISPAISALCKMNKVVKIFVNAFHFKSTKSKLNCNTFHLLLECCVANRESSIEVPILKTSGVVPGIFWSLG